MVKSKLDPTIASYIKEGGGAKKQGQDTKAWKEASTPKLDNPTKSQPKAGLTVDNLPNKKDKE